MTHTLFIHNIYQVAKKEKELLEKDSISKHEVIADLIKKNNQIIEVIDQLSLWKEEAEEKLNQYEVKVKILIQEKIESEGLAERIAELENEVNRHRSKYQNARKALAEMEHALVVRYYIHFHAYFYQY